MLKQQINASTTLSHIVMGTHPVCVHTLRSFGVNTCREMFSGGKTPYHGVDPLLLSQMLNTVYAVSNTGFTLTYSQIMLCLSTVATNSK